ncbi:hypothetical protein [Paenibacillus sp. FSL H3-0333]|uniref:hypothetical protein n=1 Tax=Paenibacillus sp. FSL H3-0333 TaxID=2921373 RepID=UPI0030FCBC3A
MRKHIRDHMFIYLLIVPFFIFSIFLPDASIEMAGGFAWVYLYCTMLIGTAIVWIGLFGGEVSYSSIGLKGLIRQFTDERLKMNKEIEELRDRIINEEPRYAMRLLQFNVLSDRRLKRLVKEMKKTK